MHLPPNSGGPGLRAFGEAQVGLVLDSIYDAAVSPGGWRAALDALSLLFRSQFADVFARTHDWEQFRGCAVGLDRADYDDCFLGVWCKRNVWSKAKPVRVAGEVLATWQMVDRATMMRSDMYQDYLRPRALNEGLRMSLWADADWIQDVSLLRPWSAGPFDDGEIALARMLLPHLQRAASLSRRLGGAGSLARVEALAQPAFLLDQRGRVIRMNGPAAGLLDQVPGLAATRGVLEASAAADRVRLDKAIGVAAGAGNAFPSASSLTLATPGADTALLLDIVPVLEASCWSLPGPRAVLVVATRHAGRTAPSLPALMQRFGLTRAEAEFAVALCAGRSLAQIAAETGRSIHTVRSHNARLLAKTDTTRQVDAVRLLCSLDQAGRESAPVMRMLKRG